MTAFWPPDDPLVLSRMALEGRASRFHCCLANGRLRRYLAVAARSGEGPFTYPLRTETVQSLQRVTRRDPAQPRNSTNRRALEP